MRMRLSERQWINYNNAGDKEKLIRDLKSLSKDEIESNRSYVGIINEHQYIDLGLPSGCLWATCNIGSSSPDDDGMFYSWGETETNCFYFWDSYKFCNGAVDTMTKYCLNPENGNVDNISSLLPEDDVATSIWGKDWRMPYVDEVEELVNHCVWKKTVIKDNKSYMVGISKINGKRIIMPISGRYFRGDLDGEGVFCSYWSKTLLNDYSGSAYVLDIAREDVNTMYMARCCGLQVRPVVNR